MEGGCRERRWRDGVREGEAGRKEGRDGDGSERCQTDGKVRWKLVGRDNPRRGPKIKAAAGGPTRGRVKAQAERHTRSLF